jgi:hypothetical protein
MPRCLVQRRRMRTLPKGKVEVVEATFRRGRPRRHGQCGRPRGDAAQGRADTRTDHTLISGDFAPAFCPKTNGAALPHADDDLDLSSRLASEVWLVESSAKRMEGARLAAHCFQIKRNAETLGLLAK